MVRFREKIVAAGLDRFHAVAGVAKRGHEDHGDARGARVAFHAAAHFEAGRAVIDAEVTGGHRDVENREIGAAVETRRQRRRRITRHHGAKAERFELVDEQLDVRIHIVGNEDQRQRPGNGGHRRLRSSRRKT